MRLTKKQAHDLRQLIKRGWCKKPNTACDKCVVKTCRDNVWTIISSDSTTYVPEKELSLAERLLKQHYDTIAGEILLEEKAP